MKKIKQILKSIGKFILDNIAFTMFVVVFNIGYLVYFNERMFMFYEITGDVPDSLIVPTTTVFGSELALTALITITKKKYKSKTDVASLENNCSVEDNENIVSEEYNMINEGDDAVG